MPDRPNEPEIDHDRLIEMSARLNVVEREIDGIRDWRHNQAAPVMMEIQAAQRRNIESIGKLTTAQVELTNNVNRIASSVASLSELPRDFREHQESDDRQFESMKQQLVAATQPIHAAISQTQVQVERGHLKIILWLMGVFGATVLAVLAAVQPHLGFQWH